MSAKFADLDLSSFAGAIVVLDVDGTLLPDGAETLTPHTGEVVRKLASIAQVYLCTNAFGRDRTRALATQYAVHVAGEGRKKPDPAISRELPEGIRVVIGDKYLTDGLFAAFIGARFVKVQSLRTPGERLLVQVAYLLDGLLGLPVFSLVRTFRPT